MPELGAAELADLARAARDGDREALSELVRHLQDDVYRLALRLRWDPHDAADATQEILLKVVTKLATWREEASVRTWVWRIAANHLRDMAPTPFERDQLSFDAFAADLADGLAPRPASHQPDEAVLVEEVKLGCTLGMLQCLDRDHRLAYVLGDVLRLPSDEAAEVSGTTPEAFRKRLSRARSRLRHFVGEHCGLVNEQAACRCRLRVHRAVQSGRVDPAAPRFAGRAGMAQQVDAMERLHDLAPLVQARPDDRLPDAVAAQVERAVADAHGDANALSAGPAPP